MARTRGFGSVQLAVGRGSGLPCRYGCGRNFPEDARERARIASSLDALKRAAFGRDVHEQDEHGAKWSATTESARGVQRRPSVGWLHGGAHYPRAKVG